MTTRMSWPLWQPSNETLGTVAEAVAAHWNAAKAYRERVFWPTAESWLTALTLSRFQSLGSPSSYHFTKGGKLIK
jgi:hypothetical protein